jgi:ubiquitin carboxyl-terminal hydrolase 36/42
MLAAPLHPAPPFSPLQPGEEIQCKPAKDLDAFNALLPAPIEFVEGSSAGMMFDETKYTPINASPRSKSEVRVQLLAVRATSAPSYVDKIRVGLTT